MAEGSTLQGSQCRLGAPTRLPALERRRAEMRESVWLKPSWRSPRVFVDGSGHHPKDPAAWVVGFGICGRMQGSGARRQAG